MRSSLKIETEREEKKKWSIHNASSVRYAVFASSAATANTSIPRVLHFIIDASGKIKS